MGYTNAFGQPQGLALNFINKIREAAIAEVVAINTYATHIANSEIEEINIIWHNIMLDEKEHYGLFLSLIRKYDPEEYEMYVKYKNVKMSVNAIPKYQPSYDQQLLTNNIREDIKGEMEAIILYEEITSQMPYDDIIDVFNHVIIDEKEHVEHLTRALVNYDTDKYANLN